jgi:hypothetical protein
MFNKKIIYLPYELVRPRLIHALEYFYQKYLLADFQSNPDRWYDDMQNDRKTLAAYPAEVAALLRQIAQYLEAYPDQNIITEFRLEKITYLNHLQSFLPRRERYAVMLVINKSLIEILLMIKKIINDGSDGKIHDPAIGA